MPSIPQPLVPDDDGSAAPDVTAALQAFQAGTAGPADVLTALSGARLLVPVVALLTESEVGSHGLRQEKESEMALPKLVGKDGREAVVAFTGAESLALWRADARPIQISTLQVCRAAVGEGAAAVVIDVAGPAQFVIEGGALEAMAAIASGRLPKSGDTLTVTRLAQDSGSSGEVPRRRRFGWLRRRQD